MIRRNDTDDADAPVSLAEHLAFTRAFQPLFDEGMTLVDETATYLDGEGRREAKHLGKALSTLYAAESMRLTTRLMQLASWLLLQRAANEGDMSRGQVEAEKSKVRLEAYGKADDTGNYAALPEVFRGLVERAYQLERRIAVLDAEIYGDKPPAKGRTTNPVGEQIDLLKTAFHR